MYWAHKEGSEDIVNYLQLIFRNVEFFWKQFHFLSVWVWIFVKYLISNKGSLLNECVHYVLESIQIILKKNILSKL